jgi:hypothetical protein
MCPGYRQEQKLQFHNENIAFYATNLAKDRRSKHRGPGPSIPGDGRPANSCSLDSSRKGSLVSGLGAVGLLDTENHEGEQPDKPVQIQDLHRKGPLENLKLYTLLPINGDTPAPDIDILSLSP